ncbi:citrate lyase acyl carrier protein [Enterococcus sp. LJL120]
MKIEKNAIAGTLESSDVQVTIRPLNQGLDVSIQSSVMNQYGRQIKKVALETLEKLEVENASVTIVDKGALECTLKARIECAIFRSVNQSEKNISWGVM